MKKLAIWALSAALGASVVWAQSVSTTAPAATGDARASQPSGTDADADADSTFSEEMTVTTASRTEQNLHETPAAVTVITPQQIEQTPADDYGDLLRNVPGLSLSQISARDVNVTGRLATNSLSTYQLVLMDNRSIYLDFFGFVMWDFLPLDTKEIKQIEVVRGPGSAVWGANALGGVINILTKAPKEMKGGSVTVGGGELGTRFGNITYADAKGKFGWKVSGSYYEQDPYDRPTGKVPVGGGSYPDFKNGGTEQPKLNFRFDYDQNDDTNWSFQVGTAKTDGLIHTGIGPFDIDKGTKFNYLQASFMHKSWRAQFFVNQLDGDAKNLLTVGPDLQPVNFAFSSDTYSLDVNNTTLLGKRHILTYGATARHNKFDLSLAPVGDNRDEYGVFLQDDIMLSNHVRWLIGGRYDDVDPIGSVFSPRTSLLWQIVPDKHSVRVSYNRAFRAPSLVNNYLDVTIVNVAPLPTGQYAFPSLAHGNPDLTEERLEAYEVGYTGTVNDVSITLAIYRNILEDSTDFFTESYYTAANPPPGFPLPAFVLDVPRELGGLKDTLPATFSYRNLGKTTQDGLEFGIDWRIAEGWSTAFNYTYMKNPEVEGIESATFPDGSSHEATNTPPKNRVNLNLAYTAKRWYSNLSLNYQDEAFWTDILDSQYWGPTDSFTMVNLGVGVHFAGEKLLFAVNAQNLTDKRIQQHIFGDILSRKVSAQLTFRF
ncbi:MAG: TonB-dependent receptor [Acidobacteriota bacterium]